VAVVGSACSYRVVVRDMFVRNPSWPGGIEPGPGRTVKVLGRKMTREEARVLCVAWNDANPDGGPLRRGAEVVEE